MPREVITALALFGTTFLVGVVRVILMNLARGPLHVVFHVTFGVIFVTAIGSLWMYGLYRRRNWVRWFTIVVTGFSTLASPWGLSNISDPRQVAMYWIQIAAFLPTCILLCLPAAGRWYGRS
jgi:hypothetical protein